MIRTLAFGLPRLGPNREYKGLLEGFWKGRLSQEDLLRGLVEVRANLRNMVEAAKGLRQRLGG
ncbi:hypothetical protein [Thermus altitudinis]|uniref:hypothetical protein n=1 Tax=Thermus altitudinis TaxID=2908145 RepID=UPI001FAA502D|nr:hypothetical protein [Thermus altitudinis]